MSILAWKARPSSPMCGSLKEKYRPRHCTAWSNGPRGTWASNAPLRKESRWQVGSRVLICADSEREKVGESIPSGSCSTCFPISETTGLHQVHPTWAGTFVLAALVAVFPGVNFVLLDSDCLPVTCRGSQFTQTLAYPRNTRCMLARGFVQIPRCSTRNILLVVREWDRVCWWSLSHTMLGWLWFSILTSSPIWLGWLGTPL